MVGTVKRFPPHGRRQIILQHKVNEDGTMVGWLTESETYIRLHGEGPLLVDNVGILHPVIQGWIAVNIVDPGASPCGCAEHTGIALGNYVDIGGMFLDIVVALEPGPIIG